MKIVKKKKKIKKATIDIKAYKKYLDLESENLRGQMRAIYNILDSIKSEYRPWEFEDDYI